MKSFLALPAFIIFHIFDGAGLPLSLCTIVLKELLIDFSILEEGSIGSSTTKSLLNSLPIQALERIIRQNIVCLKKFISFNLSLGILNDKGNYRKRSI